MKILLFRHGQTYFSKNKIPYGNNEETATILKEAVPVIEKLAEHLKTYTVDCALRSELLRCRQTAEIVEEKTGWKFAPDPLLNEYREKDFAAFYKRMIDLKMKIIKKPYQTIVLCTHGAVVAAMQKMLLGEEFSRKDLMDYPKTGVIVCIEEGNKKEIDFN